MLETPNAMIDGGSIVNDFKMRATGYLMACSNLQLTGYFNDVKKHIEFIADDAYSSNYKEITIRLYTEPNPPKEELENLKFLFERIEDVRIKVNLVHVKNVSKQEMEEIISYANTLNSGLTTFQTDEQKREAYKQGVPDYSGEDH